MRHMYFLFQGDTAEISRLLKTWLWGVGADTAIGYGQIKSIDLEPDHRNPVLFADGSVRRPVPLDAADTVGVKAGLERVAIAYYQPPYSPKRPERQAECLIPDLKRMRGEGDAG